MRYPALAGLFAYAILLVFSPSTTSAQSAPITVEKSSSSEIAFIEDFIAADATIKPANLLQASFEKPQETKEPAPEEQPAEEKEEPAPPKTHIVKENESLSKIAKKYNTTWKRLFYKNTFLENPDTIAAGQKLTIPTTDEKLKKRALPTPPEPIAPVVQTSSSPVQSRGSNSGNLYTYGYCTWYVKNRRGDLPNNLGNAYTWVSRARAQGIPTGSTPRVGAVGQRGNHVVYIEKVHSNGTVTISEMNHKGWNIKSTRTVPANYFTYIY